MARATVSVVIPAYNAGATLHRALASALNQNYSDLDVVVVDDGSTDNTAAVAAACDARVRLVRQPNRGAAAARNRGVSVSRAKYVAFLDADDEWLEGRIEKTIDAIERAPGSVLAFSAIVPVDEAGKPTDRWQGVDCSRAPTMNDLLSRCWPILPSSVTVSRDAFLRAGGFDEEFRRPGYQDVELWLRARELGAFEYVAEPLVRYRAIPSTDRMAKYRGGHATFVQRVTARYGARSRRLVRDTRHAMASALGHEGLLALGRGDVADARRKFLLALRSEPLKPRRVLRLVRTLLPRWAALRLTGRTRPIASALEVPTVSSELLDSPKGLGHSHRN